MSKNGKYRFIDLFAGIGGTRLGFERAGGRCVFTSEWDKFSQITYEANFGDKPEGDIQKIDAASIPDFDILLAGFPCQPFSIAGVSKNISLGRKHGFDHAKQGNLFFDIARIIKEKRPPSFMLENVKNLVTHYKGKTFKVIMSILYDIDYKVSYKVIDGKYYVPQHRERTYIVGFDKKIAPEDFEFRFPEPEKTVTPERMPKLKDILEKNVDNRFTLTDNLWAYLQKYAEKHKAKGNGFGFGIADPDSYTRTLSARYYKDGSEILIAQTGKNPRRLTPRECARLMGFPETFKFPVSDMQAYKQFGNSIIVPVVYDVAQRMIAVLNKYYGQVIKTEKKLEYVQNPGKNTLPELQIRKLLYSKGLRYRVHASLPGKPDLVFPRKKICVFINGCFWHMHKGCKNFVISKTNTDFWMNKIQSNVDRDYRNYERLEKEGWRTIVIWECMIEKDLLSVTQGIIRKVT